MGILIVVKKDVNAPLRYLHESKHLFKVRDIGEGLTVSDYESVIHYYGS